MAVTVRSEIRALSAQPTAELAVSAATLSVSSVLLHSCEHGSTHHHARAGSTVLSLLAGGAQDLGRFNPSAGAYCELEVKFGPADESSAALPAGGRAEVLGSTLRLEGTLGQAPLSLRSEANGSAHLPVDVVLDEEHRDATVILSLDAPAALFGLDLAAPDAAAKLLERFARRVALVPAN